jgi:hypothetical protein
MNIIQAVPPQKNPTPTNPLPNSIQKPQLYNIQAKHFAKIVSKSFVVSGLVFATLAPAQTLTPVVVDKTADFHSFSKNLSTKTLTMLRAEVRLGGNIAESGLRLLGWATDDRNVSFVGGSQCRKTRPGDGRMVLDVNDDVGKLLSTTTESVVIEVEYYDSGTDSFRLEWENRKGSPPIEKSIISKSNTKKWTTTSVSIDSGMFRGGLSPWGDLVLHDADDGPEWIRRVTWTIRRSSSFRASIEARPAALDGVTGPAMEIIVRQENGKRARSFRGTLSIDYPTTAPMSWPRTVTLDSDDEGKTRIGLVGWDPKTAVPGVVYLPDEPTVNSIGLGVPIPQAAALWSGQRMFFERYRVHVTLIALSLLALATLLTAPWTAYWRCLIRGRFHTDAIVALIFLGLTVLFTYPRLFNASCALADVGDPVLSSWILQHGADRLITDWCSLFEAANFYPHKQTFAWSEHLMGLQLVAGPIIWLTGNAVLAHSLLELASFWAAAYFTFLLCFQVLGSRLAAFPAACAFGFVCYRISELSHLQTVSTQLVPLILLFFVKFFKSRKIRYATALGFWLAIQMLVSGYTAVFLSYILLLFGCVVVFRTCSLTCFSFWVRLTVPLFIAAIAVYPFMEPYIRSAKESGKVRSIIEVEAHAARPTDYLVSAKNNPLHDSSSEPFRVIGVGQRPLFPGLTITWLTVIGIVGFLLSQLDRRRNCHLDEPMLVFAVGSWVMAAGYFVLRLVITPAVSVFSGYGFIIPVAATAIGFLFLLLHRAGVALVKVQNQKTKQSALFAPASATFMGGAIAVLLFTVIVSFGPKITISTTRVNNWGYYLLFEYAPGFQMIRVPHRIWLVSGAAICLLASWAVARMLMATASRWKFAISAALSVAVLAENIAIPLDYNVVPAPPPMPYKPLERRLLIGHDRLPVYDWLANQPRIDAVAELPTLGVFYDIRYTFHTSQSKKRLFNGYSGYLPASYSQDIQDLGSFPASRAIDVLRKNRVGWVVWHHATYDRSDYVQLLFALATQGDSIAKIYEDPNSLVFEMRP